MLALCHHPSLPRTHNVLLVVRELWTSYFQHLHSEQVSPEFIYPLGIVLHPLNPVAKIDMGHIDEGVWSNFIPTTTLHLIVLRGFAVAASARWRQGEVDTHTRIKTG